jgi:hypothetical protein
MRKHPNSHREAKSTAPVFDSTPHYTDHGKRAQAIPPMAQIGKLPFPNTSRGNQEVHSLRGFRVRDFEQDF